MADNDVLIKIGADVAAAVQAVGVFNTTVGMTAKSIIDLNATMQAMATQMSGVVGSLDKLTTAFSEQEKQSKKSETQTVALGTMLGGMYTKIADGALGMVKAVVTAIPDLIDSVAETGDHLLTLSQQTGVSVESLSKWRFVASQAGTSLETMARGVQAMSRNLGGASSDMERAANKLGFSVASLRAMKPEDAFTGVLKKLGEIPNAADRARLGTDLLGRQFKTFSQLATEDIAKLTDQAKKMGLEWTEGAAKLADRFNDARDRLEWIFKGLKEKLGMVFLPAATAVLEVIGDRLMTFFDALGLSSDNWQDKLVGASRYILDKFTAFVDKMIPLLVRLAEAFLDMSIAVGNALLSIANASADLSKDTMWRGLHKAAEWGDPVSKSILKVIGPIEEVSKTLGKAGQENIPIFIKGLEATKKKLQESGVAALKMHDDTMKAFDEGAKLLKQRTKEGEGGAAGPSPEMKKLGDDAADLQKKLKQGFDALTKSGVPVETAIDLIVKKYGDAAVKMVDDSKYIDGGFKFIHNSARAVYDLFERMDEKALAAAKKSFDQLTSFGTGKLLDLGKVDLSDTFSHYSKLFDLRREMSEAYLSDQDKQLAALKRNEQAELDAVANKKNLTSTEMAEETATIKAAYAMRRGFVTKETADFETNMKLRGIVTQKMLDKEYDDTKKTLEMMKAERSKVSDEEYAEQERKLQEAEENKLHTTAAWARKHGLQTKQQADDALQIELNKLSKMQIIEGEFADWQIEQQKEVIKALIEERDRYLTGWKKQLDEVAKKIANVADALGSMFEALGKEKLAKGFSFGGEMLKGLDNFLQAKDPISKMVAVIQMATTAVKALGDAFHESVGEKTVKTVAHEFGTTIKEELGDQIGKVAQELFKGDRFTASLYKLKDIIDAAGGLTNKNFDLMTHRLRDLFTALDQGKMTTEQVTHTLEENFDAFAQHVVESGKIASQEFVDIIRLNAEAGTNSKQILGFVSGELTKLGTAFQRQMGPMLKSSTDIAQQIADQQKVLDEQGPVSDDPEAQQKRATNLAYMDTLLAKQKTMAEQGLPGIERASRLLSASFNAALKDGVSMVDAVDQLGPGLDATLATMKNLGIEVDNSSVAWIVQFRDRVNANKELVDSATGLNQVMLSMSNIGALNAETFADLQAQGSETYDKLIAAGFSETEALTMQKDFLEQVRDAHEQLGLPIDENTQKLIDNAEATGVLKDKTLDANSIMMEGFSAIIKALGGEIPDAFKKMAKSAVDESKKSKSAVDTLTGAAKDVSTELDKTDWEGWSKNAVDAATNAQKAVDGLTFGTSPGGIADVIRHLQQSMQTFDDWEEVGVDSAESVKDAVDTLTVPGPGQGMPGTTGAGGGGGGGGITFAPGSIVIDRPILKDRESMNELAKEMAKHLKTAVSPTGAWT